MAVVDESEDFDKWLCRKLSELEIDADVYGSYITGILEDEEDAESREDALEGILGSLVEDPTELCKDVLKRWKHPASQNGLEKEPKKTMEDILAAHSAKVAVEKQAVTASGEKPTDSEAKRALLAKYGEVYDEVDEDNPNEKASKSEAVKPDVIGLFQNVNVKAVADAEKVKRDKQKEDAQKKKERDKLDREKQKLKKEERKEKEKKRTQKKEKSTR